MAAMAHVSLQSRLLEWTARTRDGDWQAGQRNCTKQYCGGGQATAVLARQQRVRELTLGLEE
jgi:hypothetical protein